MNILIIDTCLGSLSVSIADSLEIIKEVKITENNQQSRLLAITLKDVLEGCNLDLKDIDTIIVTNGPGSFTGIRIGISFVLGLQAVNPCKIYVCSTLSSLNMDYSGEVLSTINAGVEAFYTQTFLDHKPIDDIQVISKREVSAITNTRIIGHYKDSKLLPDPRSILRLFSDPKARERLFSTNIEPLYVKTPYF
jgi:tRNA threonylcarbamoyl adenosine modification protein YeaZ